jgi:hypothetical protein
MFVAEAPAEAAFSLRKFDTDLLRVSVSIVDLDSDLAPQSPIPRIHTPSLRGVKGVRGRNFILLNCIEKNIIHYYDEVRC